MTTRRRFLTILAGAAVLPPLANAAANWRGIALGTAPDGKAWPVTIANTDGQIVPLGNAAMATTAPLGTTFDAAGAMGHILDPRTKQPGGLWAQISVTATSAALADGLSTAFCLMTETEMNAAGQDGVYGVIRIA